MLPFSQLILRSYYQAIGWNEDNSYSQITRSSSALLDFQLPQSLILQLANSPTSIFFTSYALDALPQLNGSLSYITTSEGLRDIGPSRNLAFKHVVDRFRIYPLPHRPLAKDELWLGGRRIEGRDYLLHSRLDFPSLNLSGLATTRLTPTLQMHLAFLSHPQPPSARPTSPTGPSHSRQPSETSSSAPVSRPPPPGNIILSLQHDTGRYVSEYTYSVQDGMFGWKGLWNFGWKGLMATQAARELDEIPKRTKGEGEEDSAEGGSKGRFSAGGEVYFSAKQRSFGISTGVRYSTLPQYTPGQLIPNHPLNPPTTITLLYNPLIGFVSTAYSAQISPNIALSSRFGVNIYSYESDLSIGGEWWIGRRRGKRTVDTSPSHGDPFVGDDVASHTEVLDGPGAREKIEAREAILEEGDLRSSHPEGVESARNYQKTMEIAGPFAKERVYPVAIPVMNESRSQNDSVEFNLENGSGMGLEEDRDGILKAKISGNWSISLLYEARIRNCLVSIGVISDLLGRQKPIRSVGIEVQYYS